MQCLCTDRFQPRISIFQVDVSPQGAITERALVCVCGGGGGGGLTVTHLTVNSVVVPSDFSQRGGRGRGMQASGP